MKFWPGRSIVIAILVGLAVVAHAGSGKAEKEFEKGRVAYLESNYAKAEKHFRAVVSAVPELWFGEIDLSTRRLINDQLGMSYGISGRLEEAKALFEEAIGEDPDYALYYYNLACAHAELEELDDALTSLRQGFERRANLLPGETFPNPREDDSFKRFIGNAQFEAAMKELGL